ncbi:MAG: AAA family ATPase [Bacteroidetes bacterium]|nr:AAA family ATPase [Bacteroidota bacterium]
MDLQYFFKVLLRRKWLLLFITLLAVAATYFLASLQPQVYKSTSVLSTGIVISKRIDLERQSSFVQRYQLEQKFNNLIESMQSRTSIRLLTYQLLLHDLLADSLEVEPFRSLSPDADIAVNLKDPEVQLLVDMMYLQRDSIIEFSLNQYDDALFRELAKGFEYDYESIRDHLVIRRMGDTDFIAVEFESESADLSEFAVNSFCRKFIEYDNFLQIKEEHQAVQFYSDLSKQKKEKLDRLSRELSNYKRNKRIINLEKQGDAVVSQIKDLELSREEENKNIEGYQQAINNLNQYIQKDNITFSDSYVDKYFLNEDVREIQKQINVLNDKYISSGNEKIAKQIEIKRKQRKNLINQYTSKRIKDVRGKDNDKSLLEKRINTEMDLAIAIEGVKSIDLEIEKLRSRAGSLVSDEAFIEEVRGEKEIAIEEYMNAVTKLNEAMVLSMSKVSPLAIHEYGRIPEEPEPSKKLILSTFAGISTFSIVTLLLFLLIMLDKSLSSPDQFSKLANLPLLGSINNVQTKQIDLNELYEKNTKNKKLKIFKEALRKLRFAVESSGGRSFLFTSTKEQEGKTFLIIALAHSLSKNNKKVLVIDTNFKNNTLTGMANKRLLANPLNSGIQTSEATSGKKLKTRLILNDNVDIIGNRGENHSPSEILVGKDFNKLLNDFYSEYDYIFLEAASLNDYSDTRELVSYVDKIIAVFSATNSIKQADKESLKFMHSQDNKFLGAILNKVGIKNLN